MWKGFPPWQQGWRIEVCFFPALWRIKTAACPLASEQGIPCCLHCRQWMCWNCWLQFMLEDVIQKSRPVCVLSPTPADSQAPSSFLATRGSLPFSPLSFLILISALECLLNGREEGICSTLPEPCWSCCHLLQTYWARLRACCRWGSLHLPWLSRGLPLFADGHMARGRSLCLENRKMTENAMFLYV